MRQLRTFFALLLALGCLAARAEPVGGLFEAEVPVASQDAAARDAAIRNCLRAVLVKLAGTRSALDNPAVSGALGQAGNYLAQFYFRRETLPPGEDGSVAQQTLLHASFQPAAVEEILRRAGQPLLSSNRPGTLLWLVVDDGSGTRRLVNREADPAAAGWLDHHAAARAVPVLYPLLDLEESVAITPEQVWNLDDQALATASQRYGAQSVLAGRLVRDESGEWSGEWRHQLGEDRQLGQGRAASLAELDGQLVDFLAETLASRFAISANLDSAEELRIKIEGVSSYAAYRQLASMLAKLDSVRQAQPALFEGDAVFFDLLTDSGIDSVLREIALITQLQVEGDAAERRFRWNGGG